jgi:2-chlorobenzoate 1,2-dioxygenase
MTVPAGLAGLAGAHSVDRRVYTDPDVFAAEMLRLFGRAWLYVAHESQIAHPGQYVLAEMAGHSVIVMRDDDGRIGVHHNRCPHRGVRLLQEPAGQVPQRLSCSYHGWSFRRDGTLRAVPQASDYAAGLPGRGLEAVACVQSYRGFVFARLAADGPDLVSFLGPVAASLDNMTERAPEGRIEVAFGSLRMMQHSNWKIYLENSHDGVHALPTHRSSTEPARRAAEHAADPWSRFQAQVVAANAQSLQAMEQLAVHCHPHGHSEMVGFRKARAADPQYLDYESALRQRLGDEGLERVLGQDRHNAVIYPGLSVQPAYLQLRVIVPLAVDRTRIDVWLFRLKGAPAWMDRRTVAYANTIHSAASVVRADDLENYERIQRGLASGLEPRVRHDRRLAGEEGPVGLSTAVGERFIRNQFAAWQTYMGGGSA